MKFFQLDFFFHTYKVLIGVVSVAVGRIDDFSVFGGLLDDVPHVLDILDGHRHELLQQMSVRMSVKEKTSLPVLGAEHLPECAAGTSGHS